MKKYFILFAILFLFTGCSREEYQSSINVLNWSSYIPDSVLRDFEEEYHIQVNYSTYSSNEELLAKVSNVKSGTYDLVFPSDYMIEIMKNKNLLEVMDKRNLSNYSLIEPNYLGLDYDPINLYSIPFLATSVVIAVNRDLVEDEIFGYQDLLRTEYRNSIVLIDDVRIIIGSALMALGYDMNSTNVQELEEAREWLLKLDKNIKAFDSDSPKSFLMTEEASIGVMWSAEAILAKEKNPNIEIVIPSEGHQISVDNFAIMKGSTKLKEVYLFIDYLLRSDVMRKIVLEYPYVGVNKVTNQMVYRDSILGVEYDKIEKSILDGIRVKNIGESILEYDKIWAFIK